MRIAVIGAGIIGVTTAHELAADGHEVDVFERHPAVASEASFANGGVLTAGCAMPSAAPASALGWLATLVVPGNVRQLGWGALRSPAWLARHLWASRRGRSADGVQPLQRLAQYSRQRLDRWTEAESLSYERSAGCLVALRLGREQARWRRHAATLEAAGIAHEWLDEPAARALEPALAESAPLHAALYLPGDAVANCRQFAHVAKSACQAKGARFRFNVEVVDVQPGTPCQVLWRSAADPAAGARGEPFDAVVACPGNAPMAWLGRAGVGLPVVGVHGYSLTAPVRHFDGAPDLGPRAALYDARHGVWISRLGQRVRVSGIAEIGTRADKPRERSFGALYRALNEWYPGAAEVTRFTRWKGSRPTLIDGLPVIGPAGPAGLWLNIGHGAHGWTLACGSARLLADQIAARTPDIDATEWQLARPKGRHRHPARPTPSAASSPHGADTEILARPGDFEPPAVQGPGDGSASAPPPHRAQGQP